MSRVVLAAYLYSVRGLPLFVAVVLISGALNPTTGVGLDCLLTFHGGRVVLRFFLGREGIVSTAFVVVACIGIGSGCARQEAASNEAPSPHWIDGNGWFGCTQPSDYQSIYTRLVGGDRQGAARRIADANTSGRLTKFKDKEEVILIRERDDLVLLRRPNQESVFWTRKEAVTPIEPKVVSSAAAVFEIPSVSQSKQQNGPTNEPATMRPSEPTAELSAPTSVAENAHADELSNEVEFERWLAQHPKPSKEFFAWRSVGANHEVVGQLISVRNDDVTIKKKDGKEVTVSRGQLSEDTNELLDTYAIPQLSVHRRKLEAWERSVSAQRNLLNVPDTGLNK